MDEQAHLYTRRYGNIGCVIGLVVSGLAGYAMQLSAPQLRLLLVAGVIGCTAIGMILGRRRDKRNAQDR